MLVELHISSIIRFSPEQIPLHTESNKLLVLANIYTDIDCPKTNKNFLWITNASSNKSAKAITSADNTERAKRRDLYEL